MHPGDLTVEHILELELVKPVEFGLTELQDLVWLSDIHEVVDVFLTLLGEEVHIIYFVVDVIEVVKLAQVVFDAGELFLNPGN